MVTLTALPLTAVSVDDWPYASLLSIVVLVASVQ